MALENAEVLSELKERYTTIVEQLNELSNTRVKIQGAIDVLQQIEDSKEPIIFIFQQKTRIYISCQRIIYLIF